MRILVAAFLWCSAFSIASPSSAQGMANPWGGGSSPLDDNLEWADQRMTICRDTRVAYQRAIESCRQIIEGASPRPAIAAALLARGDRHDDEGMRGLAEEDYTRALTLYNEEAVGRGGTARIQLGIGASYYRLRQYLAAESAYSASVRLDRGYAVGYWSRAIVRFRLGDFTHAIEDFDRAAQLGDRMSRRGSMFQANPEMIVNPRVHAGRCEARAAAGVELETAREACRQAIRTGGAAYVFSRGILNFRLGDLQAAYNDFAEVFAEDDSDGFALYGRGVVAIMLGRASEGKADIVRAVEMEGVEPLGYYDAAGLRPPAATPEH